MGSLPTSATHPLCSHGQVTSSLCACIPSCPLVWCFRLETYWGGDCAPHDLHAQCLLQWSPGPSWLSSRYGLQAVCDIHNRKGEGIMLEESQRRILGKEPISADPSHLPRVVIENTVVEENCSGTPQVDATPSLSAVFIGLVEQIQCLLKIPCRH